MNGTSPYDGNSRSRDIASVICLMDKKKEKNVGLTDSERFHAMENLQEIQRMPGVSPVNLNYFGSEQCESGYTFGPFIRTSYVIHMIRKGKGRLMKNGSVYDVSEGQAFIIYPGEETTYQADNYDPWNYMWVGFHGLMAEELVDRAGFSKSDPVITCRNKERVFDVTEKLLSCCELTYVNDLLRTGYMYLLMGLLTDEDGREHMAAEKDEGDEKLYIRAAVNLLINSDRPQIKVSDVAASIGISRGYLTRIFKKEMGISPQDFQRRFRMERAGDLLRSTQSPVSTVAEELGYTDVLSFSKSFHNYYGMSPTAFREQKVVVIAGETKGSYVSEHPL